MSTQSLATQAPAVLAQDMLHNKPLEDAVREIAVAWKRAHGK